MSEMKMEVRFFRFLCQLLALQDIGRPDDLPTERGFQAVGVSGLMGLGDRTRPARDAARDKRRAKVLMEHWSSAWHASVNTREDRIALYV